MADDVINSLTADDDDEKSSENRAATLLHRARRMVKANGGEPTQEAMFLLQSAQVYATLALAEATPVKDPA